MIEFDRLLPLSLKRRIHRLLGNRIEITWIRSSELDPVLGELDWVEEVIFNMAAHARAAMPFGGRLLIECANVDLDDVSASAEGLLSGRFVMFELTCLRNTPEGLSEADTLSAPTGFPVDTSLNNLLPDACAILQSIGGTLCEYNEPGRALTLRAFFPSAAQALYSDEKEFAVTTDRTAETILLVEDETYVRDVACEILESAGYHVLTADSGKNAIEIFRQHGPFNLLVTDVVMPGMNGHDLSKHLTSLHPNLKTIYMSGYTDNAIVRLGFQESEVVYIQKPFTLETLTTKVREALSVSV